MKKHSFNLIQLTGILILVLLTGISLKAQPSFEKKTPQTAKTKLLQIKETKNATTIKKTEGSRSTLLPDEIINLDWFSGWDTLSKDVFTYVPSSNLVSEKINKFYAGNNTYENDGRETNTYDAATNLILKVSDYWNSTSNSWEINSREEHEFDMYNNSTLELSLSWDINLNQWDTMWGAKNVYTYSTNGDILTSIYSYYDNGTWVNDSKEIKNYNTSNFLTSTIYQSYNGIAWTNDYKEEYVINSLGEWTELTGFEWTGSTWDSNFKVINISWYNFAYFKPSGYTVQEKDFSTFINSEKFTGTFHTNGEALSEIYEIWDGSAWGNNSWSVSTFDNNDNLTENLYYYWDGSAWSLDYGDKMTYTYDSNNNILTIEFSWLDWNGNWEDYMKHLYIYNSITVNVKENVLSRQINVYPNPFHNELFIETDKNEPIKISVYNMTGKQIFTQNYTASNVKTTIDLSEFTLGVYMIQISTSENTVTKKVVKN
ncbi:MAG: T9SS type A sorting domain-containing protein [Bacteroidota bacterium]|nr:T9SS type A sorting domain-containing protein [Bacteroidota bacterium]